MISSHRKAELRSLALHRAVAERLRGDPTLVKAARDRVGEWLADGSVARPYAEAWAEALGGPLAALLDLLVDPGQRACDLRQVSPFAGVLDPRTRWRILDAASRSAPA